MKTVLVALLMICLFMVGGAEAAPDSPHSENSKKPVCLPSQEFVAQETQDSTDFRVIDLDLVCGACKFNTTGRIGRCYRGRGNPCIRCRICDL